MWQEDRRRRWQGSRGPRDCCDRNCRGPLTTYTRLVLWFAFPSITHILADLQHNFPPRFVHQAKALLTHHLVGHVRCQKWIINAYTVASSTHALLEGPFCPPHSLLRTPVWVASGHFLNLVLYQESLYNTYLKESNWVVICEVTYLRKKTALFCIKNVFKQRLISRRNADVTINVTQWDQRMPPSTRESVLCLKTLMRKVNLVSLALRTEPRMFVMALCRAISWRIWRPPESRGWKKLVQSNIPPHRSLVQEARYIGRRPHLLTKEQIQREGRSWFHEKWVATPALCCFQFLHFSVFSTGSRTILIPPLHQGNLTFTSTF